MTNNWIVELSPRALREIKKLDTVTRRKIRNFIDHLSTHSSPRMIGAALAHSQERYWRYRMGDYRLICELQDHKMVIWVVSIAHRKEVYRVYH